ncbi:pentapeptide repeat-containing protein [Phytomonospora endophytica]|uniref:pentapeptide repeat-containing protein n=1 Tax=Phytomonospora endophytica TaxID=714109 RepID=UPI001616465C
MDIDPTGAHLHHLSLTDCRLGTVNFYNVTFTGNTEFDRATFTGNANFSAATFTEDAKFDGATFTRSALFIGDVHRGHLVRRGDVHRAHQFRRAGVSPRRGDRLRRCSGAGLRSQPYVAGGVAGRCRRRRGRLAPRTRPGIGTASCPTTVDFQGPAAERELFHTFPALQQPREA